VQPFQRFLYPYRFCFAPFSWRLYLQIQYLGAKIKRMNGRVPHLAQYQGSKRLLAPQILQFMPRTIKRLIEPFAGMAAITIAAAAEQYHVNDINSAVVLALQTAIETPGVLIREYTEIWKKQFDYPGTRSIFIIFATASTPGKEPPPICCIFSRDA
jgi:hypothetical protein